MKRLVIVAAIALVPVAVPGSAAAGNGGCRGDYTPDARGVSVALSDICFDPLVVRVKNGQTVRWTNMDDMPHNLVGSAFRWGTAGEDLHRGQSIAFRFAEDGVFPYACTLHPAMIGAVVVGDGVPIVGQRAGAGVSEVFDVKSASAQPVETKSAVVPEPELETAASTSAAAAATLPTPPAADSSARAVDAIPAGRATPDRGGLVLAGFAFAGALALAAVAFLARRTAPTRELVG